VADAVLLAGGGTAGHVNPLLAVADALAAARPGIGLVALGTAEGLESRLVPEHGLELAIVPRVPLPRRPTPDWLRLIPRLRAAVRAAGRAIDDAGVGVVVGFGGYVSTPAYLAARRRRVPIVVHEQNARPGLANRLGARWAREVAVTFPATRLPGARVTGLPLRAPVARLAADRAADPVAMRTRAAMELGLDPAAPTLLVTGGSLGAASLNRAVAGAAEDLLAAGVQVVHLTGTGKAEPVRAAVEPLPGAARYQVREYLDRMDLALAVADLVLCRAGASTVCELAALGIPAVYVPLPFGNGEQRLNAAGVVAAGGGLLVEDGALDADWVRGHLLPLLVGPAAGSTRARMAAGAAKVGVRDAAAKVASLVLSLLPTPAGSAAPGAAAGLALAARRPGSAASGSASAALTRGASAGAPGAAGLDGDGSSDVADTAGGDGSKGDGSFDAPALAELGHVHLIGVGGAGMSAVAALLRARGLTVSGSDAADGPALAGLRTAGVDVHVGHDAALVGRLVAGRDTVVVSSAVRETNPELAAARAAGVRVLHRSQALAALMAGRDAVAVAGAHGKTTTSAMVATALLAAGRDPSFAIGGVVLPPAGASDEHPSGARDGAGPFVAEADESDGSFLNYSPLVAVVTNVEPDHLDHYGTREAFEDAFARFAGRIRPGGLLVACADDEGAARLVARVRERLAAAGIDVVTYGRTPGADVVVGPTVGDPDGTWATPLTDADGTAQVTLAVPGDHNGLNAAAAWAALRRLGLTPVQAATGLAAFRGTGRRFEDRGSAGGVRVVDDYAHHPTEVAALLRAARQVTGGRLVVLFQPHLYSRTKAFAGEFAAALSLADEVVVTDVYAAREDPDPQVTGALITDRMAGRAHFVPDRLEAARVVASLARPGDLLLTVGAGDVTALAPVILETLAERDAGSGGEPEEAEP
jgi:UDP-N-acetylmuramate--alanine ligase